MGSDLVWAAPLAALLVVAYLGVHAWMRRGEVITITFKRAADAKPGDTKVWYQGVEAGHLLKIVPNKDGRRLDFLVRLVPEAKPGLNTNARFWLIGASPNLSRFDFAGKPWCRRGDRLCAGRRRHADEHFRGPGPGSHRTARRPWHALCTEGTHAGFGS